jgi:hypothetical protein
MGRLFFLACFVLTLMCLGCGSEVSDRPVANVAGNRTANSTNAGSPGNSSLSNISPDAVPVNSTSENPIEALRKKKLKELHIGASDPTVQKPDIEAVLKGSERPAPEDSLFAVALVDNIIERRIFLKHPTLKMVEKVTTNDGRSSLKVVTRDGRSFDLDGNAIGPVSTAASFTILRAIGLEGPARDGKQRPPAAAKKN